LTVEEATPAEIKTKIQNRHLGGPKPEETVSIEGRGRGEERGRGTKKGFLGVLLAPTWAQKGFQ